MFSITYVDKLGTRRNKKIKNFRDYVRIISLNGYLIRYTYLIFNILLSEQPEFLKVLEI